MKKIYSDIKTVAHDIEGRIGPPLLLYFLGVPGGVCLLLWLFIWHGK